MAATLVGVDIGSRAIRAVEVSGSTKARPTVVRYAEAALKPGIMSGGEVSDPAALTVALKQLWKSAGFGSKSIVLGIGNQRVFARNVELPQMSKQQLAQSLHFHVQDVLPMPAADAVLDFVPLTEGTGTDGPIQSGLLVAAPKAALLALVGAARSAGLNALGVDLNGFALARAQGRALASTGTIAVVNVGASTTTVVVISEGVPAFVRMIPLGGSDITRALARRLDLAEDAAESAKRALGYTQAPRGSGAEHVAAAETIGQVAGELVSGIRNTVQYYSTQQSTPVQSIVLSGGGAKLEGLPAALTEFTGIPVREVSVAPTVDVAKAAKSLRPADWESLTIALGLTLGVKS